MGVITKKLSALAAECTDMERQLIEDMIISAGDYVQAVVAMETKVTNYVDRKGTEKMEAVATSDSWRTGRHEALITAVNIVNRIATSHNREPIYSGDSHRRHYGDFALELVTEIFVGRM